MKVEDIVRVAYNKAVKSVQTSLYGRMVEVHQVGMESAKVSLEGNFLSTFWWKICHLAHKRRAGRFDQSGRYGEMLIKEFENAGYAVKVTETTRLRSEIVMNHLTLNVINKSTGTQIYINPPCLVEDFGIPPKDLMHYLIALDEIYSRMPEIVDEFLDESMKIYKAEKILLAAASALVDRILKEEGIHYRLSLDSKGKILCEMNHQKDKRYRKSCRSDLEGLQDAVINTIPLLTAYRFSGYVEDV